MHMPKDSITPVLNERTCPDTALLLQVMNAHAQLYNMLAYRQSIAIQVGKEEGTYIQCNKG